jgi:hypothetical protein
MVKQPKKKANPLWKRSAKNAFIGVFTLGVTTMSGNAWSMNCLDEEHERCDALANEDLRICDEQWDRDRDGCREAIYRLQQDLWESDEYIVRYAESCYRVGTGLADACRDRVETERRNCKQDALNWCASY